MIACLAAISSIAWEPLAPRSTLRDVRVHNLWRQRIPYADALAWQRQLRSAHIETLRLGELPAEDTLLVVQHPPVLTLGTSRCDCRRGCTRLGRSRPDAPLSVCRHSTLDNLRSDSPPFELFRTERGGEVTYHGPGQLLLYPVLDLRAYRQDVDWYLRSLEEVAIRTVGSLGLPAHREQGLTGVWVEDAKVCAIGVKLSRWVTMHGLALNVHVDLDHFEHIVPCGISDRPVTSIRKEHAARTLLVGTTEADLLERTQALLLRHFGDVFSANLREVDTPPTLSVTEDSPKAMAHGQARDIT